MTTIRRDATGTWISHGNNIWIEAENCRDCDGWGEVEVDVYKPQSFNRDIGYIDTAMGECEGCNGLGVKEKEYDDE